MIASESVEYVARPSKCSPSPWKALNRNLLLLLSLVKGRGPKPMVERRLPHAGQELHGRGWWCPWPPPAPPERAVTRQPSAPPRPNWCHVRWIEACPLQATLIARRRKEETVEGGWGARSNYYYNQTLIKSFSITILDSKVTSYLLEQGLARNGQISHSVTINIYSEWRMYYGH